MKKVLSVALTVIMVVSMFAVCVSAAPEGTAIKTAADFAAMTADGKYYLANDIKVDATWGVTEALDSKSTVSFNGTLDGNGHKITVSVPLFGRIFNATIKNITFEGAIGSEATPAPGNSAPIARAAGGTVVIENITNNATIYTSGNAAGILGRFDCYMTNTDEVGGTDGKGTNFTASSLTMKNIVNNAAITGASHTAGLISLNDDDTSKVRCDITAEDCVNNGKITYTTASGKHAVAGLFGNCSPAYKDADGNVLTQNTFKNCVNNGEISAAGLNGSNGYTGAAGIIGAIGGNVTMYNCKNAGAVSGGKGNTAGLIGSLRNATLNATIENCDSVGAITADESNTYVGMIFGRGDNAAGKATVKNCYYTGNIALNGKLTDGFTLTPDGTPANASVYKAPETTAETTTAAGGETTTDKKETDSTGDTSMIIALTVVGIVAFIGTTAVVMRKKEN